jgi:hypothetical protein
MNTTLAARITLATQALGLAQMRSSAQLCIDDAQALAASGNAAAADQRLEKAASFIWGFARPAAW